MVMIHSVMVLQISVPNSVSMLELWGAKVDVVRSFMIGL